MNNKVMNMGKMEIVHKSDESKKVSKEAVESSSLYKILVDLPKPEAAMKLNAAQKKWWYWFGCEFVKTNQFTKLDLVHLQNAAVSMDIRCKMINQINILNKEDEAGVAGFVQKFKTGATNVSGYQTMYEKATKQLDDVSAHFGLSIKDRGRLKDIEIADDNQLDLFKEIEKMLHG